MKQATIVTLTMNPALDVAATADVVRPTDKIRCVGTRYDPGGGGINVARMAHVLGASVMAVFPAGGYTGAVVTQLLGADGVPFDRLEVADSTRESFTVNERSTGQQYRFVMPGPQLNFEEQARCLDHLRQAAVSAEFVVASGSLPPGVPAHFYQKVADMCRDLGVLLILDTSGGGLTHIRSGVFVLKASLRELRECVGRELDNDGDVVAAARELIDRGVTQSVVVSLGPDGALLVTPNRSQRFAAVSVHSRSGVGAGDAMVAGITVGLSRAWPLDKSVRYGIGAGTAKLLMPGTSACTRTDTERFFDMVADPVDVDVLVG